MKEGLAPFATLLPDLSICNEDAEIIWVKICKPENKKLLVAVVYRSPAGNLSKCVEYIRKALDI